MRKLTHSKYSSNDRLLIVNIREKKLQSREITDCSFFQHTILFSAYDIPFDRQQLADFLKIDRTSLSKELSKMQSEGLITYKKNHFIIDKDQRTKSHWNKSNGCVISC